MPLFHPGKQVARLAQLIGWQRRRIVLQGSDQLPGALAHRLPVVHHDPYFCERRLDLLLQPLDLRRIGLPVDLIHLPAFRVSFARPIGAELVQTAAAVAPHLDDRVDDQVHRQLGAREDDPDRIDQEWHVIGHDHHDRVRTLEAVACGIGIEDAHQRLPRRPTTAAELEVPQCRRCQSLRPAVSEILFAHAAEVGLEESLPELVAAPLGDRPCDRARDAGDLLYQGEASRGNGVQLVVD